MEKILGSIEEYAQERGYDECSARTYAENSLYGIGNQAASDLEEIDRRFWV